MIASAVADLPAPVDGVSTHIDDESSLVSDVTHARELGFGAKLCIHPRQVAAVNAAMGPSDEEVEWARHVLAHAQDGVAVIDGAWWTPLCWPEHARLWSAPRS